MTKLWKNLLIGAFLVAFVVLLGFFNATKPRILVLQSAGEESSWAQQVDRGIRGVLDKNRRPLSVEWYYLGVDAPVTPRRADEAKAGAHRAIARFKPDIIIAVDDEANSLVARNYAGRSRPGILYVSLNRPPEDCGYAGVSNVTGVAEHLPVAAVRDAVGVIFAGQVPRLGVIGVDNETGRAEMAQVNTFDLAPLTVGAQALVTTAEGWQEFVESCDAEVLLVLGTHDLPSREGGVVRAAEINRWTQQNARGLPVGTQVNFVEDGGALSFSPPPDDYGNKAMQLALDWLDTRDTPGAPPAIVSDHFEVAVRQAKLAERGLVLPPIYLEAARENGMLFR